MNYHRTKTSSCISTSNIIGEITGNSGIAIARQFGGRKRNIGGETFWVRGSGVSAVGFDEDAVRHDMRHQSDQGEAQ